MNEQKLPKVLPGYSGRRLPGRSTKEKCSGRRGRRRNRGQESSLKKVVPRIKEKVSEHNGDKEVVQRPALATCHAKLGLFAHRKW